MESYWNPVRNECVFSRGNAFRHLRFRYGTLECSPLSLLRAYLVGAIPHCVCLTTLPGSILAIDKGGSFLKTTS
jgi:hypothetical protein